MASSCSDSLSPNAAVICSFLPAVEVNACLFHVALADILEAQAQSTNRPGACRQLPMQDSSGEPTWVHPVDVTKPSEAALAQHGKHAGGVSKFQDFRVGYFLLPRDAQDAA